MILKLIKILELEILVACEDRNTFIKVHHLAQNLKIAIVSTHDNRYG